MKIECLLLDAGNKCNLCNLRQKCFKVWKYAAHDLAQSYKTSLEHIAELTEENEKLRTRIDELADLATIKIIEEELNAKKV
jgi:vacuolar-type H+-ATPase subunit I/STV1